MYSGVTYAIHTTSNWKEKSVQCWGGWCCATERGGKKKDLRRLGGVQGLHSHRLKRSCGYPQNAVTCNLRTQNRNGGKKRRRKSLRDITEEKGFRRGGGERKTLQRRHSSLLRPQRPDWQMYKRFVSTAKKKYREVGKKKHGMKIKKKVEQRERRCFILVCRRRS